MLQLPNKLVESTWVESGPIEIYKSEFVKVSGGREACLSFQCQCPSGAKAANTTP